MLKRFKDYLRHTNITIQKKDILDVMQNDLTKPSDILLAGCILMLNDLAEEIENLKNKLKKYDNKTHTPKSTQTGR